MFVIDVTIQFILLANNVDEVACSNNDNFLNLGILEVLLALLGLRDDRSQLVLVRQVVPCNLDLTPGLTVERQCDLDSLLCTDMTLDQVTEHL